LDHAETRRGKASVNRKWDITRSTFCGVDVLAVGARILARMHNEKVLRVLARVVHDLVLGTTVSLIG
jgi:geranylgeranyl pyrophosphate synthase